MTPIEISVLVVGIAIVVSVVVVSLIRKAKGKSGCGYGCSGCPHASSCQAKKTETTQNQG